MALDRLSLHAIERKSNASVIAAETRIDAPAAYLALGLSERLFNAIESVLDLGRSPGSP